MVPFKGCKGLCTGCLSIYIYIYVYIDFWADGLMVSSGCPPSSGPGFNVRVWVGPFTEGIRVLWGCIGSFCNFMGPFWVTNYATAINV